MNEDQIAQLLARLEAIEAELKFFRAMFEQYRPRFAGKRATLPWSGPR